ncbi:hypothetical protein [Streptomyces cinereoruber]|uniref:hypothetical protein n=1 Tax=Streptomyces cinereoruber TaxID=67260 RepID=UPI00362B9E62
MAFRVTLQFEPGGGLVTGTWGTGETPRRVFREWIGLYAKAGSTVVIELFEETSDGGKHLIDRWPPPGDVPSSSDVTGSPPSR